jgi:hypothetical protein
MLTTGGVALADDSGLLQPLTVYKTPTCGCCSAWIDYMREEGFTVTAHDLTDLSAIKTRHGLRDARLASCHTAIIDGYLIEGHVPADDVRRLLRERPPVIGLTAPGMPMLSPGMNSREPRDYDVLSFDSDGNIAVFSRY